MATAPATQRLTYRARDIRDATGYSLAFIYRLIDTKQIPAVRVGRSVRVMHDDLVAFLEANRVGGGAE